MNEEKKFYASCYEDGVYSPTVLIDPACIAYVRECGNPDGRGHYHRCAIGAGGREFVVDDSLQVVMESIYGLDSSALYTVTDCQRALFLDAETSQK